MAPLSPLELTVLVAAAALAVFGDRLPRRLVASRPAVVAALGVFSVSLRFERLAPAAIRAPLVAASVGCLLALPLALSPARTRWLVASASLAVTATLALSDVVYLWTYGDVIPAGAFRFAGQTRSLIGPAWASLPRSALWIFAPAALALLGWWREAPKLQASTRARVAELAVLSSLATPGLFAIREYVSSASKDSRIALRPVAEKGFLFAHFRDLARAAVPKHGDRAADVRLVSEYRRAHPHRGAAHPWFGVAKGKSVLFVQVESLNGFLLDAVVDGERVMPTLGALCERSLCFDHVLDQTDVGRSSDADHLVMTSLLPLSREALSITTPEPGFVALPAELARAGYATFSSIADHPTFWNAGRRHESYGLATSFFRPAMVEAESFGFGMADGAFFRQAAPRVLQLEKPFFAWLITLSLHAPFAPPPPELVTFRAGALHGTPLGSHLEIARYVDDSLKELFASLDRGGALEDTVVVVYGDHGESYQLERERIAEAGTSWGDMPARVPLVIHVPGSTLAERSSAPMGLIDVAPTLLTLLGRPVPEAFLGRAAEPGRPHEAVRVEGHQAYTEELAWTGERCVARKTTEELDASRCADLRARASALLEASNATLRWELR